MLKATPVLLAAVMLGGCGGLGDYKAPSKFTVSDSAVTGVVKNAINNSSGSPGLQSGPTVNCFGQQTCVIEYTIKTPAGISTGTEMVDPTSQIWKAMFEDPRFQHGTITVEGPVTSVGGKSSNAPLFTLVCNRGANSQIDWDNVDSKGIETLCAYTKLVNGI